MFLIDWAENRRVPDWAIRMGIRWLLRRRVRIESQRSSEVKRDAFWRFVAELRNGPVAIETQAANDQHYETPPEFFELVLGPRLKYSCCQYENDTNGLRDAEERMLQLTCERAELEDGMRILELGCGWGSLTLWMAERYPNSQVTAVSNSNGQREFIMRRAESLGLSNLRVITADMCDFDIDVQFDRVVSVEMFEHMRNYQELMRRVSSWLTPDGKLFLHIFCHRELAYAFETEGAANWMGRHFFTGGIMPSEDLPLVFQDDLQIEKQWRVSGTHYWRTCEDWLANLDRDYQKVVDLFAAQMPIAEAKVHVQRWRMFFLACAELFRYDGGGEWFVSHYRMQNRAVRPSNGSRSPRLEKIDVTQYV